MCEQADKVRGYEDCYKGNNPEKHASEEYLDGYGRAYEEIERNTHLTEGFEGE